MGEASGGTNLVMLFVRILPADTLKVGLERRLVSRSPLQDSLVVFPARAQSLIHSSSMRARTGRGRGWPVTRQQLCLHTLDFTQDRQANPIAKQHCYSRAKKNETFWTFCGNNQDRPTTHLFMQHRQTKQQHPLQPPLCFLLSTPRDFNVNMNHTLVAHAKPLLYIQNGVNRVHTHATT